MNLSKEQRIEFEYELSEAVRPWVHKMWKRKEFHKTFDSWRGKLAWRFKKIAYWVDEEEMVASLTGSILHNFKTD